MGLEFKLLKFLFQEVKKKHSNLQRLRFLEFNSKMKLGDQLIKLQNDLKNWGTYKLNSVIISRVPRILTSQNRFV